MLKLTAIAFALSVVALAPAPAFAEYTQEQQAACQDDAFRLCGDAVPDERRVRACMVRKIRELSPRCRRVFRGGGRRR
jgi:hypothetical protein